MSTVVVEIVPCSLYIKYWTIIYPAISLDCESLECLLFLGFFSDDILSVVYGLRAGISWIGAGLWL